MGTKRLSQSIARLWKQVALLQKFACRARQAPPFRQIRITMNENAKGGIADAASDSNYIVRLGGGATHHRAMRYRAERGDGNRKRSWSAIGIAAE